MMSEEEEEMFSFSSRLSKIAKSMLSGFSLGSGGTVFKVTENSEDSNRLPDFSVTEVLLTCLIIPDPNGIL